MGIARPTANQPPDRGSFAPQGERFMARVRNALVGIALGGAILAVTVHANAASRAPVAPTPESGVARVAQAKAVAYRQVLAQFDAAIRAQPHDAGLAVARCRFID